MLYFAILLVMSVLRLLNKQAQSMEKLLDLEKLVVIGILQEVVNIRLYFKFDWMVNLLD